MGPGIGDTHKKLQKTKAELGTPTDLGGREVEDTPNFTPIEPLIRHVEPFASIYI
jgi:hypothetical protein